MKRLLLSFMAAGGLALMAASPALAVNPLCGHSYGVLISGANPLTVNQDGSSTRPGALTAAVGVGQITFGAPSGTTLPITCAGTGELVWNDGDTQSAQDPGVFSGPAHCYDNFGLLNAFAAQNGIPCFDGSDHMSGVVATFPSAFGNGASDLQFTATQAWTNGLASPSSQAFDFTVQASTGGATVVGGSVSPAAATTSDLTKPVVNITLQKQKSTGCPTTVYGVAPYLGNSAVSVSSFGSNGTDLIAASISGGGNGSYNGGYDATVGAVTFFGGSLAGFGGGSVSLNANDDIELSAGTFPTGTNDCSFALASGPHCTALINSSCQSAFVPGMEATTGPYACCTGAGTGTCDCTPEPATDVGADCTSNTVAVFGGSPSNCALVVTNPGVGFSQSSVTWGATDTNAYFTNTAFISGATAALGDASGFTPGVGSTGAGLTISSGAVPGKITTSATATQTLTVASDTSSTPVTKNIKLTSTTPASCTVSAALGGTTTDGNCTVSVTGSPVTVAGDTIDTTSLNLSCACTGGVEDNTASPGVSTVGASLTLSSSNCPLTNAGPVTVNCNN